MNLNRLTSALLLALCSLVVPAESGNRITNGATAIEAAKHYMKSRCTTQTPCKFKPEHEGKQWRVWVQLTKRSPSGAPRPYPGGSVVLYFDEDGSLKRRLDAD